MCYELGYFGLLYDKPQSEFGILIVAPAIICLTERGRTELRLPPMALPFLLANLSISDDHSANDQTATRRFADSARDL